jgi:hypothetical protein
VLFRSTPKIKTKMHEGKVFAVERDGTATQASASSKKQRCEKRPTLAFVCNNHRGNNNAKKAPS